jgi:hypothetical protein
MFRVFAAAAIMSVCASGTTIVAIWTPEKLVIAGDSLLNLVSTSENGQQRARTAKDCKIRKFGKSYVSAAGLLHVKSTGFDIWDTAARACASAKSVDSCVAKLKTELQSALAPILKENRGHRANGRPLHEVRLTVLVAGIQGGVPVMDHITFLGTADDRLTVKAESFRKARRSHGRVILGDRDAIDEYERTHPTSEEDALTLVKLQARATPRDVGPPFSLLVIDAIGDRWIEPGCCGLDGCTAK